MDDILERVSKKVSERDGHKTAEFQTIDLGLEK
jgi:hypothetical protein